MNRRSFFNSLSAAVAGCYLAAHVRLADVVQQAFSNQAAKLAIINPAWINAPYEFGFCFPKEMNCQPWPKRLEADLKTVVYPFIEVEVGG